MILQATSVGTILECAGQIADLWDPVVSNPREIWYRGQPKRRYELLPTLHRGAAFNGESSMFERFKALGYPFSALKSSDEWEWYFNARHHGLPTRLLDWSESLLVAVYFAVAPTLESGSRLEIDAALAAAKNTPVFDDDSPTIWMLDAGTLNAYSADPSDDCPFIPGGPYSNRYLPAAIDEFRDDQNELPIAILPPRSNTRLAAQRGVFTLHGHSPIALNLLPPRSDGRVPPPLGQIVLDRANLPWLWCELETAGIDRLAMFPDLDSVARQVSWEGRIS